MIIDGKALADERILAMRSFVDARGIQPRLVAIAVDPDAPTRQFLRIKTKVAERIGALMETVHLPSSASIEQVEHAHAEAIDRADGVVLQLPFPSALDVSGLLAHLPSDVDPDCLGVASGMLLQAGEHIVVPPVVSAIRFLTERYEIPLRDRRVVVVGQGRLVGAPAALWFESQGSEVIRLTKKDSLEVVSTADIVVLGAGSPGLIQPHMLPEGAVVFDAGTSEEGGRVVGDADPACREKASLFTPVPGGIGPLAVAELFGNVLTLRFDYQPVSQVRLD